MPGWLVLGNPSEKGKVMDKITRIGVDLAKNVIVRPASRVSFCFTGADDLMKPVVPSTVPYPDMRGW
jgi:hypothetical protein